MSVQNMSVPSPVAFPESASTESKGKAKGDISFKVAFAGILTAVRWSDVLAAASDLSDLTAETAKGMDSATPAKVARKVAQIAPSKVLAFRVALSAYSTAKGGTELNPTQRAELASKFESLRTGGKLTEKTLTFGGIALFPLLGEM